MGKKPSKDHYLTDEYCRMMLGQASDELLHYEAAQALQRILGSEDVLVEYHPWTKRWYGKVKGDS